MASGAWRAAREGSPGSFGLGWGSGAQERVLEWARTSTIRGGDYGLGSRFPGKAEHLASGPLP